MAYQETHGVENLENGYLIRLWNQVQMRWVEVGFSARLWTPVVDAHGIFTLGALRDGWFNAGDVEVGVKASGC